MTVSESPDELTLRAEGVGALKTYINVNHIEEERWGPPLVDYDWYVGVKKPHQAQKAKTLWKMKAAKEAGEEFYDPTRQDNIR